MRVTGESNCNDCPPERNEKKVPSNPSNEADLPENQSGNSIRKKKEREPLCVKYPMKKPGKFFSSIDNRKGTQRGKAGGDFVSSIVHQNESKITSGGSNQRFLTLREAGRCGEAIEDRPLLSLLLPPCQHTPKRFYGKCGGGSKTPKNPPPPDCSKPKKTPQCPPPKVKPTPTCPPEKVKFRECPPPPKLPKVPKCPPPCPPPPPPPVPKCPDPPKCPPPCAPPKNCPSTPTKPPKSKCSGRQMSTYRFIRRYSELKEEIACTRLFHRSCPVFLVPRRRVSSSFANFMSKSKSGKNDDKQGSKGCKNSNESQKNGASKKSTTDTCAKPKKSDTNNCAKPKKSDNCVRPKKPATDCCAKPSRRAPKRKDCKKPKSLTNCPTGCAPKPRCPPVLPPPRSQTPVKWTPPVCPPSKFMKPSPCPEPSKQCGQKNPETPKTICPPPPPLPKPPCRPVCLCPCPPPPKLPPGSCPDVPTVDEPNNPICPPPCPPKVQPPCPKDTWCPPKTSCPSKK